MEKLLKGAEQKQFDEGEAARAAGAAAAAAAAAANCQGSPDPHVAAAAAAAAAACMAPTILNVGDQVEVFGLQSEAGRKLNGMKGKLTKFVDEKGRWQVELGLSNVQSLKPENLRP